MKIPSLALSIALGGASLGIALVLPVPAHAQPAAAVPPELPLRDFFRNPERAFFRISQGDQWLGFMQPAVGPVLSARSRPRPSLAGPVTV